jgi:hypothetical protein
MNLREIRMGVVELPRSRSRPVRVNAVDMAHPAEATRHGQRSLARYAEK